jgi:hypothetical protein
MKYMINFQITLTFEDKLQSSFRTSYTVIENEIKQYELTSLNRVQKWFAEFFLNSSLDAFIDTSKLKNKVINKKIKIGRITNSLSGEYKTFQENRINE